ncbi:heat shock 70 kDa protein 16 isoform X1 [Magnolia sinica]|uniref:heat shock 70 kDa protein 16 isoform X1 n=1 Tax=Magnolia sinica TaxID=86752 RepID=UPI002657E5E4|nr:heat shock 70 kDa protein 16 isoform X1 [Magnolia sinica]
MSVVGFDIANDRCVVAAARQRGIDVLLNEESNRETPAVVSFGEKQRFVGATGAASLMMNPKSTISQIKRLIGLNYREPSVQDELRRLPFATSEGPDGVVLVHVQYMGGTHVFTPVQILAMLLSHLKQVAEKSLEVPVTDCVIGIPSYFTDGQRRAYLSAAAIAGLKPLRLLHDSTAIALGYGIYRSDFGTAGPTYIAFVDIGHCDTQVSVVAFEVGQMKIVSHAFDPSLGGRDFDEVLFHHFAAEFKEKYAIDVLRNARASIRLRAACEKLKKVLSANAEAPINIECLMDEKDVKGLIKREEFEKLSLSLLERISRPCKKALAETGLSVEKIHSVELVGSGSRIPAIARMVSSLFNREPGRTVNASECVAHGCALQCAMLSPLFRVRDYEVQDSLPFSIGFSSDEGPICTLSNSILFPKGQHIPSTKILTFHRTEMFRLEAFYGDPSELSPGVSPKISCFTIGPFPAHHGERPKVKVRVQLNLHGIIIVESASLIEDETDDTRATVHSDSDKMETEFASAVPPDTVSDSAENGESLRAPAVNSAEVQPSSADVIRKGRSSRRIEIPVTETIYGGLSKAELLEAQEKEIQLARQDRVMEQTKDKRNALEAYIYGTRNKLFDTYRSFATDSEKEEISRNLQQTEDWLYEDGDDESEKVYTEKLEELQKLVDPIETRFKDEETRPQATRDFLKRIVDYRMAVKSLANSDRDAVLNECNKAEQWLREKTQLQDSLPKNTDPVLSSDEIKRQTEALDMTCRHIIRPKASPTRPVETKGTDRPNIPDNGEQTE